MYRLRVRYRYLNKGKSLYGYVLKCDYDGMVTVEMDDGEVMYRSSLSWDIVR